MGAKCQARSPSSRCKGRALAISLSAVRAVLRLMQHSCGSARHRTSAVQRSCPAHVRHRSSKVRRGQTWPLFRKGLRASACGSDSPLLNSRAVQRPCHFLVSNSQTLPGVQDTALRFRSVPLAQTVTVSPVLEVGPCHRRIPGGYQSFPRQCPPQSRACLPQTAPVAPFSQALWP